MTDFGVRTCLLKFDANHLDEIYNLNNQSCEDTNSNISVYKTITERNVVLAQDGRLLHQPLYVSPPELITLVIFDRFS